MTAAGAETNGDSIKSVCAALKDKQLHEVFFLNNFFLRQK
jgi:ribosomal protein L12E/L44/L45/RPP1/RPP2